MRREMTNAEFRLWWRLRRPGIEGLRFRRQVPIGPYIVDFLCPERALIVEVDGDQHGHDEAMARDKVRTEWLAQNGYQVIRFWNDEVVSNIDGVCSTILAAAQDRSPR
jgi:very-short-patch-repair endonuclease